MIEVLGTPKVVEDRLTAASAGLVLVQNHSGIDLFNSYIEWVNVHVRLLSGMISEKDVDGLLRTRGYWSLRDSNPMSLGNNLTTTINREIEYQKARLDDAVHEVHTESQRWFGLGQDPLALILDTGVVEAYGTQLLDVDWHGLAEVRPHRYLYLVVPRVVIDELDRHKQSRDQNAKERRNSARAAIRALWSMFGTKSGSSQFRRYDTLPVQQGQFELLNDDIEHIQMDDPDAEMLRRSRELIAYLPTKVVTFDTGMALRGMASGIDVLLATAPNDIDD